MMLIDFLFWHYYCYGYNSKIRTKNADLTMGAIVLIYFTNMLILAFLVVTTDAFICEFSFIDTCKGEFKLLLLFLGFAWYAYLQNRYYKQKTITKSKYKVFRERWGDPEHVSKKNMRILLWYTIFGTIGVLIYVVVMGILNKHGYFEGCRLFP